MSIFSLQPGWASRGRFRVTAHWMTGFQHGLATLALTLASAVLLGLVALIWSAFWTGFTLGAFLGVWVGGGFYLGREALAHRFYYRLGKEIGPSFDKELDVHIWDSRLDAAIPVALATTVTALLHGPTVLPWCALLWWAVWRYGRNRPHPELQVDGLGGTP